MEICSSSSLASMLVLVSGGMFKKIRLAPFHLRSQPQPRSLICLRGVSGVHAICGLRTELKRAVAFCFDAA